MRRIIKVNGGSHQISPDEIGIGFLCKSNCKLGFPALPHSNGIDFNVLPVGTAKVTLVAANDESMIDDGSGPKREVILSGQINYHIIASDGKYLIFGGPTVSNKQLPQATDTLTKKATPKAEPVAIET